MISTATARPRDTNRVLVVEHVLIRAPPDFSIHQVTAFEYFS
jgi:hypothetical protein